MIFFFNFYATVVVVITITIVILLFSVFRLDASELDIVFLLCSLQYLYFVLTLFEVHRYREQRGIFVLNLRYSFWIYDQATMISFFFILILTCLKSSWSVNIVLVATNVQEFWIHWFSVKFFILFLLAKDSKHTLDYQQW